MPILKQLATDAGASVGYHRLLALKVDIENATAVAHLVSHVDEQSFLSGRPLVWNWNTDVSLVGLSGPDIVEALHVALTTSPGSPFAGGQIVVDQSATLDSAKARAWIRIKLARAAAEVGSFIYAGGSYQADKERIPGAVVAALLAKTNGWPYLETWTLTDNTTRELDADAVIGLGMAMMAFVSGIFAHGRMRRAEIEAATTIEEITSIAW